MSFLSRLFSKKPMTPKPPPEISAAVTIAETPPPKTLAERLAYDRKMTIDHIAKNLATNPKLKRFYNA